MIVITAAMVAIAVGRDSQRLAVLALAGGLVTPMLVSTGMDHQVVLFGYLAVLAAGMLAVARAKDWPVLAPLSFAMTQIYFWGWYADFYKPEKLEITAFFATLFFALFAALPMIRSRREGRVGINDLVIVLANPFLYLLALREMLWPDHRWLLAAVSLALAAVHLELVRSLPRAKAEERRWFGMLYAGISLTFATLAIPMLLDDKWITLAWAVEGAVLVWSGVRMKTLANARGGIAAACCFRGAPGADPDSRGDVFIERAVRGVCGAGGLFRQWRFISRGRSGASWARTNKIFLA